MDKSQRGRSRIENGCSREFTQANFGFIENVNNTHSLHSALFAPHNFVEGKISSAQFCAHAEAPEINDIRWLNFVPWSEVSILTTNSREPQGT